MNQTHSPFAAELLEVGASGYAALAVERLMATHRDVAESVGPRAQLRWRDHFQLRIRELAAALASGEEQIFIARVVWTAHTFTARGLDTSGVVLSLQALHDVLEDRLPDQAKAAPLLILNSAQETVCNALPAPDESAISRDAPAGRVALEYLQRTLEGDVREALDVISRACEAGMSARVVLIEVLLAAQREVGRLWQLNQLTVAEEHLISSTTMRAMANVVERAPRPASIDVTRSALAATLETDYHDLGLRAIGYLMELEGWRVYYLGADVPPEDLVGASSYFGVDLIMLSASMAIQLRTLREAVTAIKENAGLRAPVLVGGRAFADAPETWVSTGADAFAASAEQALVTADRLVPLR